MSKAMRPKTEEEQSMEHTELDLTQFPLETDDSVVLTEKNIRHPLVDNIMEMPVQSSMSARINLKDYPHPETPRRPLRLTVFFPSTMERETRGLAVR